jgi:hypothetical protein
MTKSRFQRSRPYREGYLVPAEEPFGYPGQVKLRRPDKTIWQAMKDYINNLKKNEVFKRKDLLNDIYRNNMASYETSVDKYRVMLVRINILEHTDRGLYKKVRQIPEKLNTQQLHEYAYKTSWRSWFTPYYMLDELKD